MKSLIWFTDTNRKSPSLFSTDFLEDGCLIMNFDQLKNSYAYFAYSPYQNPEYSMVATGMWDGSWVDMIIVCRVDGDVF